MAGKQKATDVPVTVLCVSPQPGGRPPQQTVMYAEVPQDQADRYIMVQIPDTMDTRDFYLALESAMTTLVNVKTRRAAADQPLQAPEAAATPAFSQRNSDRLNGLKESVLADSRWLLAREVSELTGSGIAVKNPSAVPNRWKRAKKIFAIPLEGKDLYPAYALDEGGQPLPVVKKLLELFGESKTPWSLAFWFGSPNSWLSNQKPKDCLVAQPEAVYHAAQQEREGPLHG
ncbi:hypothetical protein [Entomohabitans teleogrylli]|uniref:hypothetical protein n=1 Tax=Entomohabitans teleogrylli TaxID=1384589 RepID=UPI0008FC50B9|nr:hypothetical protein [Entomohabitans teleogrylli]